ncbi:MAG: hypothetical protein ABI091_11880, partial [Ferruginibacter sp.]
FSLPMLNFTLAICSSNSAGLFGLSRMGVPLFQVFKTEGLLLREYHPIFLKILWTMTSSAVTS